MPTPAWADSLSSLEGNMCGTVMRGADALPGSKATSRAKGSHRNLGGLISDPLALCLLVNTAEVKQHPIGRGSLDELQAFVKTEVPLGQGPAGGRACWIGIGSSARPLVPEFRVRSRGKKCYMRGLAPPLT